MTRDRDPARTNSNYPLGRDGDACAATAIGAPELRLNGRFPAMQVRSRPDWPGQLQLNAPQRPNGA
jgi:hypothetical protein